MSQKKVTLRDIAKECNVSVATVSYVLNHSDKEKISNDTRLKIAQTATRLHYSPTKRKTKKSNNKLVGIIVNLKAENMPSKTFMYYDLAAEISSQINQLGYHAITLTTSNIKNDISIIKKHNLDALFMIDVDSTTIKSLTKNYYIPIIFMDCDINDSLFCNIYPNYDKIFDAARNILNTNSIFLATEDFINRPVNYLITKHFNVNDIYINTPYSDFKEFLEAHKNYSGIILGDLLGAQAEKYFDCNKLLVISYIKNSQFLLPKTKVIHVLNKEKAITAVNTFKTMIDLGYEAVENNVILLNYQL